MAVIFNSVLPEVSATISNPVRGNQEENNRLHALGRTAAGTLITYSKGIDFKVLSLRWEDLFDEEKKDLDIFFNTINGPTTVFFYTDHHGTTVNAQFIVDKLPWEQVDDQVASSGGFQAGGESYPTTTRKCPVWNLDIELEVVPQQ